MAGRTLTVVLGGGRGTRLHPLTAVRAKPAVPLGGKYRLIDIPISNSLNSGLREIFVLTQFNSASLNAHVTKTYRFDPFSHGTVEILAAEQTDSSGDWYQGTADAVRQHLHRFSRDGVEHVMILSGDHLYRMDYRDLIERHEAADADITISTIPVNRQQCTGFGVVGVDKFGMVRGFREKPPIEEDISDLEMDDALKRTWGTEMPFIASMGVYVFRVKTLETLLEDVSLIDFGHHILPYAVSTGLRVAAHLFDDYWEDIGTVRSFYEANIRLCEDEPPFRFYEPTAPIYTRARFLPPTVVRNLSVDHGLVADGCLLLGAEIVRSVIGIRTRLMPGSRVEESVVLGADYFETAEQRAKLRAQGRIPIGIGQDTSIKRAIIDKNARIGRGVVIHGDPNREDETHEDYVVRDGIIIVRKGVIIPDGSVL